MFRTGVGLLFAFTVLSLCQSAAVAQAGWAERGARPRSFAALYPTAGRDGTALLVRRGIVRRWDGARWARVASVAPAGTGAISSMVWDHDRECTVGLSLDLTVFPYQVRTFELRDGVFQIFAAVPGNLPIEMHYDPALGGAVVFCETATGTQDYLWDGTSWNPLPADVRPVHVRGAIVADRQRQRLVAFTPNAPGPGGETYEWDGTSWTQRQPSTSPSPRDDTTMLFDPATGLTMLYGGSAGGTTLRDTWFWNGTDWSQSTTNSPPTSRAVDLVLDRTQGVRLVDMAAMRTRDYRWNGSAWVPGAESLPMVEHSLIGNDRARGVLTMLMGGNTYDWDGFDWHLITTSGPGPRSYTTLAFDPSRNEMVTFGGVVGSVYQLDTWTFDGAQWTQETTNNAPSRRHSHAMFTSTALNGVVLFGGDNGPLSFDDTWLWQNGTWTELFLQVRPPAGRSVGTAGRPGQTPVVAAGGELWSFDGSWTLVDGNIPYPAIDQIGLTRAGDPVVATRTNLCYEYQNGIWLTRDGPDTEISDLGYDPVRGDILAVGFGHEVVYSTELATSATVGQACTNDRFTLSTAGDPFLGNGRFRVHADGAQGFAVFAFAFASNPSPLGSSCISYLSNPVSAGFVGTNAYNVASLPVPIPMLGALRGLRLYLQAAGPQPNGPFGGLAVSAGLEFVIGG